MACYNMLPDMHLQQRMTFITHRPRGAGQLVFFRFKPTLMRIVASTVAMDGGTVPAPRIAMHSTVEVAERNQL